MNAFAPPGARAERWLPLLRALSKDPSGRIVIKDPSRALAGVSDVDVYAPRAAFPSIERRFRRWADDVDLAVAAVCHHDWRGPTMVAVGEGDPHPWVLDVKVGRLCRGSFLFTVDGLEELTHVDRHGVRAMRPGADGTARLLIDGTTRSGARTAAARRAGRIKATVAADPTGALAAARFAGPVTPALRRGIEAYLDDDWSRPDMAVVMGWLHARALARPDHLARQLHWRRTAAPACPMTHLQGQPLPPDVGPWLAQVSAAHRST